MTTGSEYDFMRIDENGEPIAQQEPAPRGAVVLATLNWAQAEEVHCEFDLHWGATRLAGGGAVPLELR